MLSQCPPVLQEAFYHALFAMLNPMLPESAGRENCNSLTSHGLLNEWDSQPRTVSSPVADLVCLQTLIMLIIEADYGGISAVKGQSGGPKKLSLLGEAVGLGYIMKLYLAPPPDVNPSMDLDPDSEKNIALRAWWTLVALDRWNAVGTAAPSMISSDVVVTPGLRNIMGDVVYNYTSEFVWSNDGVGELLIADNRVAEISFLLTQFIPLFLTLSAPSPSDIAALTTKKPLVASLLNALMESFRWQFPDDLITPPSFDPTLLLAYWHVRLLVDLCSGGAKADFALQDCANIVGILTGNPELLTPLNHHFISLVSLALLELEKLERTRDDAGRLLKDLLDYRVAASPWTGVVRDKIMSASLVNRERSSSAVVNGNHNNNAAASSQSQVQSQLQAVLQSQSLSQPLQQLADLATVAAGVEQNANDASAENMVSSAAAVAAAAAAVAAAAAAHQQQNAALSSVSPTGQVIPTSLDPEGNSGQARGESSADRDVDMDMGGPAATGNNEERHTNGVEHSESEQQQQHFKTEYRSDEEHEFKTEPQPETRPEDHQSRQQQQQQQAEQQQEPQQHVLSASPIDENGIAAGPGQTETSTSVQEPESQQSAEGAPARDTTNTAASVAEAAANGTSSTTADQNANKEDGITPNGTTSANQASVTASLALSLGSGFGSLGLNATEIYEHYQRQQQELQLQKQAQQAVQQAAQQSQSQPQSQSQVQQNSSQEQQQQHQQQQQQQPYHQQRFDPKEAQASSQHQPHQPQSQQSQQSQQVQQHPAQMQAAAQPQQPSSIPLSQAQAQAQAQAQLQQVVAKQQQLVLQTLQQHQQQIQGHRARPYEPEVFLKAGYLACFGDDPVGVVDATGNGVNGSGNGSGSSASASGSGGIGTGGGGGNNNIVNGVVNGNGNGNGNGNATGNGTSK